MAAPTVEPAKIDALSLDGDTIRFAPVSCLLTADELDQKCEEQFAVIWNGINKPA